MTETFIEFLKSLEPKVRKKYLYVIQILKTEAVVSEKFIKHLENTNLYEMRVSLSSNEYRTIVFSVDAVNIISATKVLLLNSFLKKDTKQDRSEINKAVKLLEEWRNEYKWKRLKSFEDILNEEIGAEKSLERTEFEARAKAYYYAELLKEQRKQQKMTQQQLADKIGKKREYISNIERGNSDMQLSTFMQIANALGLRFALVVG